MMRRFFPSLLLTLLLALPNAAQGQASAEEEALVEEDGAPDDGGQSAGDDGGYEPDQRGFDGEQPGEEGSGGDDQATGDDGYEPDQRGVVEAEQAPLPAEPGADRSSVEEDVQLASEDAEYGRDGIGVDVYLWLGAGLTGLDAIDGDNLVLPTQMGSFGGSFGVTLGARVGPLSIGPRFSLTVDSAFVLTAVGLDAIVALTEEDTVVPTARVALSYAFVTPTGDSPLPSQNSTSGLLIELGVGFRASIGAGFFLGGELSGGYIAMFRRDVPACEDPCTDMGSFDLRRSGFGHGLSARLHFFAGRRF